MKRFKFSSIFHPSAVQSVSQKRSAAAFSKNFSDPIPCKRPNLSVDQSIETDEKKELSQDAMETDSTKLLDNADLPRLTSDIIASAFQFHILSNVAEGKS